MPGKRPLRQDAARELEDMSDDELAALSFFGDLVSDSGERLFVATAAQKEEAWRLLKFREERGAA
jgi:hypothetical protein